MKAHGSHLTARETSKPKASGIEGERNSSSHYSFHFEDEEAAKGHGQGRIPFVLKFDDTAAVQADKKPAVLRIMRAITRPRVDGLQKRKQLVPSYLYSGALQPDLTAIRLFNEIWDLEEPASEELQAEIMAHCPEFFSRPEIRNMIAKGGRRGREEPRSPGPYDGWLGCPLQPEGEGSWHELMEERIGGSTHRFLRPMSKEEVDIERGREPVRAIEQQPVSKALVDDLAALTKDGRAVERTAWLIVDEMWRTQKYGIFTSKRERRGYETRKRKDGDAQPKGAMKCSERMEAIIRALETDVQVAIDTMEHTDLEFFVGNPEQSEGTDEVTGESKGKVDRSVEKCNGTQNQKKVCGIQQEKHED